MKPGVGETLLQAKEHLEPPGARRGKGPSLGLSGSVHGFADTWFPTSSLGHWAKECVWFLCTWLVETGGDSRKELTQQESHRSVTGVLILPTQPMGGSLQPVKDAQVSGGRGPPESCALQEVGPRTPPGRMEDSCKKWPSPPLPDRGRKRGPWAFPALPRLLSQASAAAISGVPTGHRALLEAARQPCPACSLGQKWRKTKVLR